MVLPPIANYTVGLLKETALCSIIAAPELMLRAKDLASSSFLPMHAFVLAAIFYYAMSFPMMRFVRTPGSEDGARTLKAGNPRITLCPEETSGLTPSLRHPGRPVARL